MQECRNAGMQTCRNAGIQECRNAGTQKCRKAGHALGVDSDQDSQPRRGPTTRRYASYATPYAWARNLARRTPSTLASSGEIAASEDL